MRFQIEFIPAGKTEFTGAQKNVQIQLQRQTGQHPAFVVLHLRQQFRQAFQRQGGVMLGHDRGHDTVQIVSRIIFDDALLHGVAHNFSQMLAHSSGDVMHAFIVNRLNQLRKMAGFNLSNIHRANHGENVAFQTGEDFIGVRVRPEFKAAGVPRHRDRLKGAGFLNGGVVRFTKLRRAESRRQQLTCCIALFAGFCQCDLRIGAEGQTVFLTAEAIAEIP